MSLTLAQSKTALGPNCTASFLASGGTEPYTYSVAPGGANGTIDSDGLYTAPAVVPADPDLDYDTIVVTDSASPTPATAEVEIYVGNALLLFCEIIRHELNLADGRVFLWDQKIFQPTDEGLYVAVAMQNCKVFGNNSRQLPVGTQAEQYVSIAATLDLNVISRDNAAVFQKELVLMALTSVFSQQLQEANSFLIGKVPPGSQFNNLSIVDGAAIPYRYQISIVIHYSVSKTENIDYFDTFQDVEVVPNP